MNNVDVQNAIIKLRLKNMKYFQESIRTQAYKNMKRKIAVIQGVS